MPARWGVAIALAVAVSFALKLILAVNTYGSNDLLTFQENLRKIKSDGVVNLYRDGIAITGQGGQLLGIEPNCLPPFSLRLLMLCDDLEHAFGPSMRFWVRCIGAVADLFSLLLVIRICRAEGLKPSPWALILTALSPVAIMITGFHGNLDPLMMLFLLVSLWLIENKRAAWLAGAAFGAAVSIKVVPLICAPAILLYLPSWRRRVWFFLATGAVVLALSMPYALDAPGVILSRVVSYGGATGPGAWGISQVLFIFLPHAVAAAYLKIGKALVLSVAVFVAIRVNASQYKQPLFLQCGFIVFSFLLLSPGFGVQYLCWLVPWAAALKQSRTAFYYLSSSAFLFTVYTAWSGGLPWFYANSFENHPPPGLPIVAFLLGLACWISVGLVCREYWTVLIRKEPLGVAYC